MYNQECGKHWNLDAARCALNIVPTICLQITLPPSCGTELPNWVIIKLKFHSRFLCRQVCSWSWSRISTKLPVSASTKTVHNSAVFWVIPYSFVEQYSDSVVPQWYSSWCFKDQLFVEDTGRKTHSFIDSLQCQWRNGLGALWRGCERWGPWLLCFHWTSFWLLWLCSHLYIPSFANFLFFICHPSVW